MTNGGDSSPRMPTIQDKLLIQIAREFRKGILDGAGSKTSKDMCYMVCAPLASYLCGAWDLTSARYKLIEGEVREGRFICSHFWIELEDGRILDPTADQFKTYGPMPKVYLGPRPKHYLIVEPEPQGESRA